MTDMKKVTILLLGKEEPALQDVASVFAAQDGFEVAWLASSEQAWNYMSSNNIDAAVVAHELEDCTGLQFVKALVAANPFVNCALSSPLSAEAFHKATEGYGVFMQLQVPPTAQSACDMIEHLKKIYQLSQ